MPPKTYGLFFEGDSYIVLNVRRASTSTFFWSSPNLRRTFFDVGGLHTDARQARQLSL